MSSGSKLVTLFRPLLRDLVGIARVLPLRQAARWYGAFLLNLPEIIRSRHLWPADSRTGGHFDFRYRDHVIGFDVEAKRDGAPNQFSWLREFFAREMYLGPFRQEGFRYDRCLDIGCNCGAASKILTILGEGRNKIVAVDAQDFSAEVRAATDGRNVEFVQAYVGAPSSNIFDLPDSVRLDPDDLLDRFDGEAVNFMKMDIEGAEFDLFTDSSTWLNRVENLAMEVHRSVADPTIIIECLRNHGFAVTWRGNLKAAIPSREADFIYASRTGMLRG